MTPGIILAIDLSDNVYISLFGECKWNHVLSHGIVSQDYPLVKTNLSAETENVKRLGETNYENIKTKKIPAIPAGTV